ncbi:MAG TPA: hypothetical protein VIM71_07135 [Lacunisphaera sp.]
MTARLFLTFLLLVPFTGTTRAADSRPAGTIATSFKLLVDTNVYLQSDAALAAGQTTPSLPADASDTVAVAGVNLGWNGQAAAGLKAEASYAPEFVRYLHYRKESYTNHRFALNVSGKIGDWALEAKNSVLYTDGAKEPLVFNRLGGGPALGGEPVRARRAQTITKAGWRLSHPVSGGFVRGVFTLLDQDFHVREKTTAGCANYADRREWYAGAEAGWWVRPGFAAIGAVRAGQQTQADLLGVHLNYANTFTRWLVGVEGSPRSNLKLNLLAGPDVRRYGSAVRAGFDREQTTTAIESSAVWTASKTDTLTLGLRRWQWLNGSGRAAYLDLSIDAGWKHTLAPGWTFATAANLHRGSCTRYNPGSPRDDLIYTGNVSVTHTLSPGTTLEAGVMHDWSDSRVINAPSREYSRWIVSAGWSRIW